MATHSSTLAWKIPWMEEPGRLQSMGSQIVRGFSIVNEAEVDIFLEFCFFYDPMDVGNVISGSSAFSKSTLNIWKFSVHLLLKPSLENFQHYLHASQTRLM